MKRATMLVTLTSMCLMTSPVMSDAIVNNSDGAQLIIGFVRINANGCEIIWNKSLKEYEIKSSCSPSLWSSSELDLSLKAEARDINKTINAMKSDGIVFTNTDPEMLSGTWGITVQFGGNADIKTVTGGNAAGRNDLAEGCSFQAQATEPTGSPPVYAPDAIHNMFAVVGQAANSGNVNVSFYKDGKLAYKAPKDAMLSWTCVTPIAPS